MRRIDRQQLRDSFYIKIKTMRQGKNGRGRHPMPELSDDYAAGMLAASLVDIVEGDDIDVTMDEFAEDWGPRLMTPEEEEKFEAMEFPLTVYRGGTGSIDEVAQGISWTLDLEIAKFYALDWPKRWGIEREPMIVSMQVECDDVAAFLVGRKESELLVPYASLLRDAMTEVKDRRPVPGLPLRH